QPPGHSNRSPGPARCWAGLPPHNPRPGARTGAATSSGDDPATGRGGRELTRRKEQASMAKTKDKVYDAAENVKPYVDRAMSDPKLREEVLSAFGTARE